MKICLPFVLMLITVFPLSAQAEKYEYVSYSVDDNYFSGKDTLTIDTGKRLMSGDHGAQRLQSCNSEQFFCFKAPSTIFAVPKSEISVGSAWKKGGQDFQVLRKEYLAALGSKEDVYVISTKRTKSRTDYFYYSTRCGLLAIKFVDNDPNSTYIRFVLSTKKTGFPH